MKTSIVYIYFLVYFILALLLGFFQSYILSANQVELILEAESSRLSEIGLILREEVENQLNEKRQNTPETQGRLDLEKKDLKKLLQDYQTLGIESLSLIGELGHHIFSVGEIETKNPEKEVSSYSLDIQLAITKRDFQGKLFHTRLNHSERKLLLFLPLKNANPSQLLVVNTHLKSLDKKLKNLYLQLLFSMSMILAFLIFLTIHTWRSLVSPIMNLNALVEGIINGVYPKPDSERRKDEIGMLRKNLFQMSLSIRDMEENAKSSNPLTGLPGNVQIERRVNELLSRKQTFCLIYGDLDNFKAYNDYYGVSRGDEVILYTSRVIQKVFENVEDALGFVGHQGGDDFVCTCTYEWWEPLVQQIIKEFDQGIGELYDAQDRDRGSILTTNRQGKEIEYPLASISLAVVTNKHRDIQSFSKLAHLASEMKKKVKAIEGSTYAIDKRND